MSSAFVVPRAALALGLAIASSAAPGAERQGGHDPTRFLGMDRNRDGVVTRDEWQGSERSFGVHDWNGDGVLSGDELKPGARRPGRPASEDDYRDPDTYRFSDWTESGFRDLDRDRDGRLSRTEWYYDAETFTRMDANHDGLVNLREFLGTADDDREDRFDNLDVNGDGRITWNEWHVGREAFESLDRNGDGVLTRTEMVGSQPPQPREVFAALDVNHDGRLSRSEWRWSQGSFAERDRNGDGVITPDEFGDRTSPTGSHQSAAYRSGHERGQVEGRQAGREDKTRDHWDLEGQRELEQADSGYTPQVGARSEYQAGYRAGFRQAYGEGFGRDGSAPDTRSAAYHAGVARGTIEGRQAGREDKARNHWDLEGQRELEQADSGYTSQVGPRSDYQAGYRAGFRRAYAEGFGPR
jgi:EF hand